MTDYFAPPDKTGLVLNSEDSLVVRDGGTATGTIINGGLEIVEYRRHDQGHDDQ